MSKKVIVLNDFLPEDIKADVMKDAPKLMHSVALQKAIDDHVTPGAYVELNGTFNLDKLEGYRPDIYGADGIKPSRDFPHITLNGSQPCLLSLTITNGTLPEQNLLCTACLMTVFMCVNLQELTSLI